MVCALFERETKADGKRQEILCWNTDDTFVHFDWNLTWTRMPISHGKRVYYIHIDGEIEIEMMSVNEGRTAGIKHSN